MKKTAKNILLLLLLGILFFPETYIPFLEQQCAWQAGKLSGAYHTKPKPKFTLSNWLSNGYQNQFAEYSKFQSPARNVLIRARNQWEYDAFATIGNKQTLPGKDNFLFDKDYIEAYVGLDFMGAAWIEDKLAKWEAITRFFESSNTHFLILFPPGKPNLFPDKLPIAYQHFKENKTNRATFIALARAKKLDFIDFDFFKEYQKTSGQALYPQAGLHWNYLGNAVAADSIKNYVQNQFGLPMPDMIWQDSITYSTDFKLTDNELLRGANLWKGIPLMPQPYPNIRYSALADEQKTKAFVVGDSYYEILLKEGVHENLFAANSPYLHYFGSKRTQKRAEPKPFDKTPEKLVAQIASTDLVIIEASEMNLTKFAFGFIDMIYQEITKE